MNFLEKLVMASRQQNSLLCVGLDPEPGRFPTVLQKQSTAKAVVHFCQAIIEATARYVCAYKPNLAFFEVLGPEGMYVFQEVLAAIPAHIPIIVDAKRGDLDNTTLPPFLMCMAVTQLPSTLTWAMIAWLLFLPTMKKA
jgi:orotidine-5'-phosphate decarboxylase